MSTETSEQCVKLDIEIKEAIIATDETKRAEDSKSTYTKCSQLVIVRVCMFILVTELCERLAFYGISGSLPNFFVKEFGITKVLATELNALFISISYITPLLGAYIADSCLGRYKTILYFSILYLCGLVLCVFASVPGWSKEISFIFYIGLYVGVAVGTGGIKPNVVVLGGDQFDSNNPKEAKQKESFFNFFYWSINVGALIAFSVVAYIAMNGAPPVIPVSYGFFASFLIPALAMSIALIAYIAGSKRYKKHLPSGSMLTQCFKTIGKSSRETSNGRVVVASIVFMILGYILTCAGFFITTPMVHLAIAIAGIALIFLACSLFIYFSRSGDYIQKGYAVWLDKQQNNEYDLPKKSSIDSKLENQQKQAELFESSDAKATPMNDKDVVNDTADIMRLLPYFSLFIVYFACYNQVSTNFMIQGCQMNLQVGSGQISSSMLNLFDCVVVLIVIPILDKGIYPCIARCRNGKKNHIHAKNRSRFRIHCTSYALCNDC